MRKRGQLQISFGMIFSIIIIIATLAVAGFILSRFMNLSTDVSCKLFYRDLQNDITKAWQEDTISKTFTYTVPSSVEEVCFGNATESVLQVKDKERFDEFSFYARPRSNLYFYPRLDGCKDGEFTYILEHMRPEGFFCTPVKNGKISVKLMKTLSDKLVRLST